MTEQLTPGDVVAGRFEIAELAGVGGGGSVYRATDRRTGALVALKVLASEDDESFERFAREAQLLAELRHPGIVRYIDRGAAPRGAPFLAMEWLEGPNLSARLRAGKLTLGETLTLGIRVADALGAAHARGFVHRDLKPSNLILVGGAMGEVKLVDFGIARIDRSENAMTIAGMILGTPGYMAPEQARGDLDLDARADVFSLGCVLFECITGRRVFSGTNIMAVLTKVMVEEAPRLGETEPGVPVALSDLVASMLGKARAHRPADGRAVRDALQAVADAEPRSATEAPTLDREPEWLPAVSELALTTGERRVVCLVLVPAHLRGPSTDAPGGAELGVAMAQPALRAAVMRHGGHLDQLLDGSLLVTFPHGTTGSLPAGAQVRYSATPTDRAAQAARCALGLRPWLSGAPIVVLAGWAAESGRTRLGEAIDRGASLAGQAAASTILVDPTVSALLDVRFEVAEIEGRRELRRERPPTAAARTLLGKPTPCVGRTRELGMLMANFDECVGEPRSRAVIISGEAGVGKSRLRHEFIEQLSQRDDEVQVWLGRADPMGAGSAFGPIEDALRRILGSNEALPAAYRRSKVETRIKRCLQGESAERVAEFLGELVGVRFPDERSVQLRAARQDARLMGDQIRRACEDFVRAECEAGAVLLVLEDLHWGDLPTLRLVETLLRNLSELPFLVVACGRPEIRERFPSLCSSPAATLLELGKLSRKSCEKLLYEVLGETVSPTVVSRVIEQADGNAFFLEELIRVAAEGQTEALPDSVLAMVEARLAALDIHQRRALRAASVFGREFAAAGARALLGGERTGDDLGAVLDSLVAAELIAPNEDASPTPGPVDAGRYVFRQDAVRDAAYAMLTEEDLVLGHQLAAAWLERSGEADPLTLGEHYQRGGQPSRAVPWFRRAAEQAIEGDDLEAAISRAERAIACGAAGEVLGALRLLQAGALDWRGKSREAEPLTVDAIGLLPPGSPPWHGAVGENLEAAARLGNHDRVVELSELLRARHVPGQATAAEVRALALAVHSLCRIGQTELADKLLQLVVAALPTLAVADPATTAVVARVRAVRVLISGDPAAGLELDQLSVNAFEAAGDLRQACLQRGNVGYGCLELGDYRGGEAVIRESLVLAERMGLERVSAAAKQNLCFALGRQGRTAEAWAMGREAVEALQAQGNRRLESATHVYLAQALGAAGNLEASAEEARLAVQTAPSAPDAVLADAVMASVELARGRSEQARQSAEQAMAGLNTLGNVEEGEALVRLVYAEALHATGAHDAACHAIRTARARLLYRASRIADPSWRRCFLERVSENARTLELAAQWVGES
jgi:eukaryotic-like serine/threonine-protein kinase